MPSEISAFLKMVVAGILPAVESVLPSLADRAPPLKTQGNTSVVPGGKLPTSATDKVAGRCIAGVFPAFRGVLKQA